MYRSVLTSLLSLAARTRPTLNVAEGLLPLHPSDSTSVHLVGGKNALRYLNGTKNKTLLKSGNSDNRTEFTNETWGNGVENGWWSRSGTILSFSNAIVSAMTTLQKRTTFSLARAQYARRSRAAKIITCVRNVLSKMGSSKDRRASFRITGAVMHELIAKREKISTNTST